MIEAVAPTVKASFTDGQWHRVHPMTPLLRGGIGLLAVIGIVIANLRDRLLEMFVLPFIPDGDVLGTDPGGWADDPIGGLYVSGMIGWALLAVLAVLAVVVGGFSLSWRMNTFRITDEVVEVRNGILLRTHRQGRLDRIQGVDISRSLLARIFGVAAMSIQVAGQDANIELAYLGSTAVDRLRRDVLLLASGSQHPAGSAIAEPVDLQAPGVAGLPQHRASEFRSPELEPSLTGPESIVRIPPARLVGSLVISWSSVVLLAAIIVGIVWVQSSHDYLVFFGALPVLIGFGSHTISRVSRSLRFSVAGTTDGIRVGHGLLSTRNETLPPGRIHALQLSQPLLWRPFGWWEVTFTRASQPTSGSSGNVARTTILPVGTLADVAAVISLILPGTPMRSMLLRSGAVGAGTTDGYRSSPPRAAWLKPFGWRRNAIAIGEGAVYLRRGLLRRELSIIPLARVQGVELRQGPVARSLSLAAVVTHTVGGVVGTRLSAIDQDEATLLFEQLAELVVSSAVTDGSHRWREQRA
ncbi:MAG: PH domain-containing protein [Microbacteriaceae bacterium]